MPRNKLTNIFVIRQLACNLESMPLLFRPSILKELINSGTYSSDSLRARSIPSRRRVVMVHPQHFKIQYAINPHMRDAGGEMKKIDGKRALQQWSSLLRLFE